MRSARFPFWRARVGLAVSERCLVGARVGRDSHTAIRELPEGLVAPSSVAPNVRSVSELAQLAEGLLDELSARGQPVALVLPDLALSTVLYPSRNGASRQRHLWDELGGSLPYPKSEARHDFWRGPGREALGAAVRDAVVSQYEEVLEATGSRPGWVDGASLAMIPSWSRALRREPGVAAQVQLYCRHYCLTVMRAGELLDLRTKLRTPHDVAAVAKELARVPALHDVPTLRSLSLFGEDAASLAEEMSGVSEIERIRIENDTEEDQLIAAISALLDRPQP